MSQIETELVLATRYKPELNNGLITFIVNVPYFIWVEILTHKRIARNASSARAEKIERHSGHGYYLFPAYYYKGNGMQSGYEIYDAPTIYEADRIYREVWEVCLNAQKKLDELGLAKEQSNRVLPAFKMVRGILTATEDGWYNFLKLRDNPMADSAMQILAKQLREKIDNIDWKIDYKHVPLDSEGSTWLEVAARIARISYGNVGSTKNDSELGSRLLKDGHLSPFEHIATWKRKPQKSALCSKPEDYYVNWGWENYRSYLEAMKEYNIGE